MNIVYLIGRFPPVYGGATLVEIHKNKELVRRGHNVFFITPKFDKHHPNFETYEGINVIRIPPPLRGPLTEILYVLGSYLKMIKLKIKPDIIVDVIPFGYSMIITRLFSKILRVPVIARLTQTGSNEPLAAQKGKFNFIKTRLFSTYNKIIAITPDLYENCKRAGIPDDRIELIPNCVDTTLFTPLEEDKKEILRQRLFPGITGEIVTVVGTVTKRKRPHLALEAWRILKSNYSGSATLVFVGPVKTTGHPFDEEYVDNLQEKIRQYGLEDSVIFTGFQKNIQEYFQASDITLFISEREGLPGVVLQSMSTEIPVVMVNLEKISEFILTDGTEGFITSDDPVELSEKIITLLSNSDMRESMGKNGRNNVLERFSIPKISTQIENL